MSTTNAVISRITGFARDFEYYDDSLVSHDPSSDVDDILLKAVKDTGADLVVMASHVPNIMDYVWPSNGGKLATHTDASVFLVRG